MKKTYISPAQKIVKIDSVAMMAISLGIDNTPGTEIDTEANDGADQLGRGDRGNTNLWDQTW